MSYFVFGDESGGLANPQDRFAVVAAVGTPDPRKLDRVAKYLRTWLLQRGKAHQRIDELHFYNAREETRRKLLARLAEETEVEIYLAILEKPQKIIANSAENYARTLWPILKEILARNPDSVFAFDKRFSKLSERDQVLRMLEGWAGKALRFEQVDSQQNPRIQIADFVAGAALAKYQREEDAYLALVNAQIVQEFWLQWDEIKKW
ncbi:MAG: hypothetical protein DCC52_09900 [Chloroflexi bacterium]|nr:MAG: hypothetical protein DCC52_09900 [Chloroflexota bacterium]